jgi:hypothetical protein
MSAKQAIRHQRNKEPQTFDVLTEHADGTVDLGLNGQVVITHCKVGDTSEPGTCTLVEAKPAKRKTAKVKATEEASADADASDTQEASEGSEEVEEGS